MKVTVGERGQITIPKIFREDMGLQPGMDLDITLKKGRLIGQKAPEEEDDLDSLVGCAGTGVDTDKVMEELRGKPW